MPNTVSDNLQRLVNAKEAIAQAIVDKGGTVNSGDGFEEFPNDIATISSSPVLMNKNITANGTYYASADNVDGYSRVNVNVPNSYSYSDNGKVVYNRQLVNQTQLIINKGGTYDTTTNNEVIVEVFPEYYSFKVDKTNSDPSTNVTYSKQASGMTPAYMDFNFDVFDYGSWRDAFFIRKAYPCMLNFDGTEAYKLDPYDYSYKLDGTLSDVSNVSCNMNAMMAIPTVWISRVNTSSYYSVIISDTNVDEELNAYAHTDRNGKVKSYIYIPIYKGFIDSNGRLRSLSGHALSGDTITSATEEVTAAEACGNGWQIWDFTTVELLCDLLTLISCSTDCQASFGKGNVNNTETAAGKLTTGTLDTSGMFYGTDNYTNKTQVKVFGIEGFWGDRYDRMQGLLNVNGTFKIKGTPPYNFTGTDFNVNVAPSSVSSDSFISDVYSTDYGCVPNVTSGSSSTYWCDKFYTSTSSGIYVARRGGRCADGLSAGYRTLHVGSTGGTKHWGIGASPLYK